jgi:DNA polymerase-3 subunit beta
MKIEVNRQNLIQILKRLSSVIPGKTTLEILHSALVEVTSLGIHFHVTDLDQWVSVKIPGEIKEKGKGLFPVKKLEKAVKAFTGDTVSITFTGDGKIETCRVELQCGKTKFKTDTMPLDEFPAMPKEKSNYGFQIDSGILSSMIEKTLYAISTDLTRPALAGILFRVEKNNIIVQASSLKLLKTYVEKKGSLWAHVGEKYIQFLDYKEDGEGSMQIYSRIIEGPFPAFEKVIPQNTKLTCTLSREDFLESVKRISVFSDALTHQINLKVKKTKITLIAETQDTGTASEDLKCKGTGPFEVGYNALYLEQALKTLENEEIKISMEGPEHAGVIEEKTEDLEHLVILMPVRI